MESESYEPREIVAPVLTGLALKLMIATLESPIGGPVRTALLRKNGVYKLLEEQVYEEEPLFAPDCACDGWSSGFTGLMPRHPVGSQDGASPQTLQDAVDAMGSNVRTSEVLRYHEEYLAGRLTPLQVAESALKALDDSESMVPPMRLFISYDPESIRRQAAASTKRYENKTPLSQMDGILFAVKDEVDVEGHETTAGTAFMAAMRKVPSGSTLPGARAFLEAGTILLGKTNMHEFGLGTTGLNTVHGTPRNPYDVDRHTGGSSSGSAAVVASGICVLAVGLDGGGSIRIPAALCGCVGLKPTHDRVCAKPGPLIAHTVGVAGPIASTVRDCALAYSLMANRGHSKYNIPTPPSLWLPNLSVTQGSNKLSHPLSGLRCGIFRPWLEHADQEIIKATYTALDVLAQAGAEIVEITIAGVEDIGIAHAVTISSEMRSCMAGFISSPSLRRKLDPETRTSLAVNAGLSAAAYVNAQKIRRRLDKEMRRVLSICDVILSPTVPTVAPKIIPSSLKGGVSDISTTTSLMRFSQIANMIGLPALTVPVDLVPSRNKAAAPEDTLQVGKMLPASVQLMGRPWEEDLLFHVGSVLEDSLGRLQKPPVFWNLMEY
jgi:Asp-tRNA(Asn)/Glu-tRNA(Gln) amidotransferase A subunit family amidase